VAGIVQVDFAFPKEPKYFWLRPLRRRDPAALPIKKETEELKRILDKQEYAGLKGVVWAFRTRIQAITMPSSSRVIASLQTLWLLYLTERQRLKI
jgi:hypothetical protein